MYKGLTTFDYINLKSEREEAAAREKIQQEDMAYQTKAKRVSSQLSNVLHDDLIISVKFIPLFCVDRVSIVVINPFYQPIKSLLLGTK